MMALAVHAARLQDEPYDGAIIEVFDSDKIRIWWERPGEVVLPPRSMLKPYKPAKTPK